MELGRNVSVPHRLWHVAGASGGVEVRYPSHRVIGLPGDCLFIPPGFERQIIRPGTRLLSIAIEFGGTVDELLTNVHSTRLPKSVSVTIIRSIHQLRRLLTGLGVVTRTAQHLDMQRLALSEYGRLQAALWTIVGTVLDHTHAPTDGTNAATAVDPRFRRLLMELTSGAGRPFPDTKELSRLVGLSWRRIEQLFQSELRCSPKVAHDRLRAREACRRLNDRECPIKFIAFSLGFSSAARFSQWFTRQTGRSPLNFRLMGHEPTSIANGRAKSQRKHHGE
jgi:AraC-like DNA-binding protein